MALKIKGKTPASRGGAEEPPERHIAVLNFSGEDAPLPLFSSNEPRSPNVFI